MDFKIGDMVQTPNGRGKITGTKSINLSWGQSSILGYLVSGHMNVYAPEALRHDAPPKYHVTLEVDDPKPFEQMAGAKFVSSTVVK